MALPKAPPCTQDNPNRLHNVQKIINCLCEIKSNDAIKSPKNLILRLANPVHLNGHFTSSSFPTPVAPASPSLSGSGPRAMLSVSTHTPTAHELLNGSGNCEIDTASSTLADTSGISLRWSWWARCSPVLWATTTAFHLTLPPIRAAFSPWLLPARKNEMVRNLLGFIIMHNNLLYITTWTGKYAWQ